MDKKRKHNRLVVAGIAAAFVAAFAAPAHAADQIQTVDATLAETLSFTIDDLQIDGWVLAPNAAGNTISGGVATVAGNALTFEMTVAAEQTRLTEWDTGTSAYVATPKVLGAPMAITATDVATGLPAGATSTDTPAIALIPAGTTLLGDRDYQLNFVQPTTLADAALGAGRTYHNELTYTVSTTI